MLSVEESRSDKRPLVGSDHSGLEPPESKRVCTELDNSDVVYPVPDEIREDLLEILSDEIREDLLEILSDSNVATERDTAIQDLDSVIKSLQDEISQLPELTPNIGESQPDLGYLLEASDNELGLPPPPVAGIAEEAAAEIPVFYGGVEADLSASYSDAGGFGEMLGFDDEFPSYDSLGVGLGEEETTSDDFVAIEGLFEYGGGCEPSNSSSLLRQPSSLPAV